MIEMLVFASALLGALATTPLVRAYARRAGLVVAPRADRWHQKPTALFGGVGIFAGATVGVALLLGSGLAAGAGQGPLRAILLAAGLMFLVGLVDDRAPMRPMTKFLCQVVAAAVLVTLGVVFALTPWTPVNVLVTLFWFVGVTNALNLLDNMDGVTAGVSAVGALVLAGLLWMAGAGPLALLSLSLAGGALGFLAFNFKPASIFMRDCGSLFVGATLAGLGAAFTTVAGPGVALAALVPVLVLLVPILDTTLVTFTRTLHNRRISQGGRDHTTHRIVAMGFSEPQAALLLYAVAGAGGAVAFALTVAEGWILLWIGTLFVAGLGTFVVYLGRHYRYEPAPGDVERRRNVLLRNLLVKRRGLELILDLALFGLAYTGAFLIYGEGSLSATELALLNGTLALVVVSKLAAFRVMRVYRSVWDHVSVADVHRLLRAVALGSLIAIVLLFVLFRAENIPRTVLLLDAILTGVLAGGVRLSFRSLDRLSGKLRQVASDRTIIFGTRKEMDLAHRVLELSPELGLVPVGFVSQDEMLHDTLLHGLPVLHGADRLTAAADVLRARTVVVAGGPGEARAIAAGLPAGSGIRLVRLSLRLEEVEPTGAAQPAAARVVQLGTRPVTPPLDAAAS